MYVNNMLTTQHLVFLSLCKALNITPSHKRRNKGTMCFKTAVNLICAFSCVNHVYVSICSTYAFYFCLCPYLCAISCRPVESVKVLCVSLRNTIICLSTVLQHTNMVNSVVKCSHSKLTYEIIRKLVLLFNC